LTGLAVTLLAWVAGFSSAAAARHAAKPPTIELAGNGIRVVGFGSSVASVTKAVSAELGPPTGHPEAGCVGGYREVAWHDLILQFRHGRFSGYRYWLSIGAPGSTASPRIATATGITLGSTLAQLRKAYDLTQTGTDFWKSPNGIVFVLDSPTYPSPPASPIDEIKSAGVCPAAL
jgi:hypothetical protein